MLVAEKYSRPAPFVRRIREWIYDGYFDGKTHPDFQDGGPIMGAGILYTCLNEIARMPFDHPLQSLRSVASDRTRSMLSGSHLIKGLYHLYSMRTEDYVDLETVVSRVYDCPSTDEDTRELFRQLKTGRGFDLLGGTYALAYRVGLL